MENKQYSWGDYSGIHVVNRLQIDRTHILTTEDDRIGQLWIKPCNVVILLGHQSSLRNVFMKANPKDLSAASYLTCWGDIENRSVGVDEGTDQDGSRGKHRIPFNSPRAGQISGFPRLRGPIGPSAENSGVWFTFPAGTSPGTPNWTAYDLRRASDETAWNGGYGEGAKGWKMFYVAALAAAARQATAFGQDCQCKCCFIDVWVIWYDDGVSKVVGSLSHRGLVDSLECSKDKLDSCKGEKKADHMAKLRKSEPYRNYPDWNDKRNLNNDTK